MAGSQAHKKGTLMRSRVFTPPATFALRCILAGCSALATAERKPHPRRYPAARMTRRFTSARYSGRTR